MSLDHQTGDLSEDEISEDVKRKSRRILSNRNEFLEADLSQFDDAPLKNQDDEPEDANSSRSVDEPPLSVKREAIASTDRKYDRGWWIGGFLFGFIVGLALSLTYGWVLDPRPEPVTPAELRLHDKQLYIKLIALSFAHNGDETRAKARLATLSEPDINQAVIDLTEQYIDQEREVRDIVALVSLAKSLGQTSKVMLAFVATPTPLPTATPTLAPTPTPRPTPTATAIISVPEATITTTALITATSTSPAQTATRTPTNTPTTTRTPTSTRTLTPTSTFTPTRTPTPGPNSPYGVAQSVVLCDDTTIGGLLRVYVRDRLGIGVPGIEIMITWSGGQESFYTGFKPDVDPGYADFQMESGQRYQIELDGVDTTGDIPEITIDENDLCPNLANTINPSWQLVFQQGASR